MRENRRLVEDAEKQAASIVGDARAQAARIRADSDRELSAATQRRDSINAQLTNVRQMLATLTGGTAVSMMDVALGGRRSEDEAVAQQAASRTRPRSEAEVRRGRRRRGRRDDAGRAAGQGLTRQLRGAGAS